MKQTPHATTRDLKKVITALYKEEKFLIRKELETEANHPTGLNDALLFLEGVGIVSYKVKGDHKHYCLDPFFREMWKKPDWEKTNE